MAIEEVISIAGANAIVEFKKLSKRAEYYAELCAGLFACLSWVMVNAPLSYPVPLSCGASEYLSVDQRAFTGHYYVIEDFTLVQLERAVDISDLHTKESAYQFRP